MGLWEAILEALNEGAAKIEPAPDRLRMVDSRLCCTDRLKVGFPLSPAGFSRRAG